MDKTERETCDLMNVESFSQLPFIRPAPPPVKEKSGGAIRLFGKEFITTNITTDDDHTPGNPNTGREAQDHANKEMSADNNSINTETSNRKFECHYCCRNFPTSQALGGHQNAHKRERQNAKRAHLQSAMVHGGLDALDYGLMNYNRFGPNQTHLPLNYHSWNSNNISSTTPYGANSRLYGNGSYVTSHQPTQPINGSPLAMWRIPAAHSSSAFNRDRSSVIPRHPQINPLFNSRDDPLKPLMSAQGRFAYDSTASMKDHVSLDLHL